MQFPPIQRTRVKKKKNVFKNLGKPPTKIAFSNIINRSLASLANVALYFTIFLCILDLIMFDNLYRNISMPVFYSISLYLIIFDNVDNLYQSKQNTC